MENTEKKLNEAVQDTVSGMNVTPESTTVLESADKAEEKPVVAEAETPKTPKKHKGKLIAIVVAAVVVIAAAAVYFTWYSSPIQRFKRSMTKQLYEEAGVIYRANEGKTAFTDKADVLVNDEIETIVANFGAGLFDRATTDNYIESFDGMVDTKKVKKSVKKIAASKSVYDNAVKAEKNEKYVEAAKSYADVVEEDVENYTNAVAGVERCQVLEAERLIGKIGTVKLDSFVTIKEARTYVDGCSDDIKAKIGNLKTLTDAEAAFAEIKVKDVEDSIALIGTVTLDSKTVIQNARTKYDGASEDIQKKVSNVDVLVAAEKTLSDLQIAEVEAKINAIGTVTLNSKAAIDDARKAFNALNTVQQSNVPSYKALPDAETKYKQLEKEEKERNYQAAFANLVAHKDNVRNTTFYQHKNTPKYINTRTYIQPYLTESFWMHLMVDYSGSRWVFWEQLIINIDGQTTTKYYSYSDVKRDNGGGTVAEYIDINVTDNDIALMRKIAASTKTVVRFQGDERYYDYTVSAADKQAIKDVLTVYDYKHGK